MKKFFVSAIMFLLAIGVTNAQTAPAAHVSSKTKTTTTKMAPAAPAAKVTTTTTTKSKVKVDAPAVKKDGTPDMRFKENKMAKEGPKKKDGTADMRYKANKKK